MFNEAQNLAIVRTELDTVFFQNFAETNTQPNAATAESGDLFRVKQITNKAWIGEINKGVGLYDEINESDVVPSEVPAVRNKYTIYVKDYAKNLDISKDLFDDNINSPVRGTLQLEFA
jgi:hypothetical protein